MPDLLLEIGVEELPAGFIPPALEAMDREARRLLAEKSIACGKVTATGTPRRLVLLVREAAEVQEKVTREVMGPARKAAFDAEGRPTKAAEGFARSQGVDVGSLTVKQTPKGEYVCALREEGGQPVRDILPALLTGLIAAIPAPKSMRWGDGTVRFARPIRWILAILGGEVVPFEYAGLASGNLSRGHRFLAPGSFTVADPDGYFRRARTASVVVDHQARRQTIAESLAREAEKRGGRVLEDENLLETVTFLVEWPTVICGHFAEDYLGLPPEVLVTSMKSHQKYFPVAGADGRLMPLFLTVSNCRSDDLDLVRRGNERVLSARLADARFFWTEDLKTPLADKAARLATVVYQEKLGTSLEKTERFTRLALRLCRDHGLADPGITGRAALLAKADLVTEMVGEFPELQGTMGMYYAREAGEPEEVCLAIREHYLPRFAGDALPSTPAGRAVSLADKMDTIVGSFGIGQKPTGSEDPYGLRRHTLGIINIILENGLEIGLGEFIGLAAAELEGKMEQPATAVVAEVKEFFRGRLAGLFVQQGYPADLVEAVLSSGMENLPDARRRLEAIDRLRKQEGFEPLAVAFKRVMNIIPPGAAHKVDAKLLKEEAENELHRIYKEREKSVNQARREGRYDDVLAELASMRPAVDRFFEEVMVMVEDAKLRSNRLALMSALAGLFTEVADFTKIAV